MAWAAQRVGLLASLLAIEAGVVAPLAGCSNDTGQTPVTDATGQIVTEGDTTDTSSTGPTEPTESTEPTTGPVLLCGNGVVDTGETCDDGNLDNSDA